MPGRFILIVLCTLLIGITTLTAQEQDQKEIEKPEFVTNPPEHTKKKVFAIGTAKNTSRQMLEMAVKATVKQVMVDTLRARFNFWANQFIEEVGDSTQVAYQMEEAVSGFYVNKIDMLKEEDSFMTPDPDIPQLIYAYLLVSYPAENVQKKFLQFLGKDQGLYNKFISSETYFYMEN
jgi:hypothetical protein